MPTTTPMMATVPNTWSLLHSILVVCLFVVVSSIPALPPLLVNHETKQCTFPFGISDECTYCFFCKGWISLGHDGICPDGYEAIASGPESSFCVGSRSNICCSASFSGQGDCANLALHVGDQKCSLTLCEQLPDGWSRPEDGIDKRCPYDAWVESEELGCDDPCQGISSCCSECVDNNDCAWSFENESCGSACPSYGEKCLIMPCVNVGVGSAELCEELAPSTISTTDEKTETTLSTPSATATTTDETPSTTTTAPGKTVEMSTTASTSTFPCCDPFGSFRCFNGPRKCCLGEWICANNPEGTLYQCLVKETPNPERAICGDGVCPQDAVLVCPDGRTEVSRDPGSDCVEFFPCPEFSCCNPNQEPSMFDCEEGYVCCPDGVWSCSCTDDLEYFVCGGVPTMGPFPEAACPCCDKAEMPTCDNNGEASCCNDGSWSCDSCKLGGIVCELTCKTTTTQAPMDSSTTQGQDDSTTTSTLDPTKQEPEDPSTPIPIIDKKQKAIL